MNEEITQTIVSSVDPATIQEIVIRGIIGPTGGLVALGVFIGFAFGYRFAHAAIISVAQERIDKLESQVHDLQEEVRTLYRERGKS